MPVKLENEDIKGLRRRLADLQIGLGVLSLLIAIFTGLTPMLPGLIIIFLGGVGAGGVYWAAETWLSRRFGLWSFVTTVVGCGSFALAGWLSTGFGHA